MSPVYCIDIVSFLNLMLCLTFYMFSSQTPGVTMRLKRHIPYWFVISYVNSDGQVITFTVKATLFYDGACVFSLAPFWKAIVAPRDKYLRVGAKLARHRAALAVVLRRLGTFARCSSRCPGVSYVLEGGSPQARPETFFLAAHTASSCSYLGLRMSAVQ